MSDFIIEAESREKTGKGASRRMRRQGLIPAILYGAGKPDVAMTLNQLAINKMLDNERFYTSLLELQIKGQRGKHTALVKAVQWDPMTDTAMHIDFHRASSSDTVHVEVPVHALNFEKCPGCIKGGNLDVIRHTLEVVCRADNIPDSFEIDCSGMDIGDVVHVDDIPTGDGVEIPHEVNFTVITLLAPTVAEEEPEAEAVEAAEAEAEAESTE